MRHRRVLAVPTDTHGFLAFLHLDLGEIGFFQQFDQLFYLAYVHIDKRLV
jgi:hypothetical protein